jgi:hypothetical protein
MNRLMKAAVKRSLRSTVSPSTKICETSCWALALPGNRRSASDTHLPTDHPGGDLSSIVTFRFRVPRVAGLVSVLVPMMVRPVAVASALPDYSYSNSTGNDALQAALPRDDGLGVQAVHRLLAEEAGNRPGLVVGYRRNKPEDRSPPQRTGTQSDHRRHAKHRANHRPRANHHRHANHHLHPSLRHAWLRPERRSGARGRRSAERDDWAFFGVTPNQRN